MNKTVWTFWMTGLIFALTGCSGMTDDGDTGDNGNVTGGDGIVFYDDQIGHDFDGDGTIQADEKDLLDGINDGVLNGDRYLAAAASSQHWNGPRDFSETFYFSDVGTDIPGLVNTVIGEENWGGPQEVLADTLADTVGDGKENTQIIVEYLNDRGDVEMAAQEVSAYRGGGHEDWFLPSIGEMAILFAKRDSLGDDFHYYDGTEYFSSTERDDDEVWVVVFVGREYEMPDGFINPYTKTALNKAHPIRSYR